jgi:hypothetical protein
MKRQFINRNLSQNNSIYQFKIEEILQTSLYHLRMDSNNVH